MTPPTLQDWRIAEVLADQEELFVLWAINDNLCNNLADFSRHFGAEFPVAAITEKLVSYEMLARKDDSLTLLPAGAEVLRQLGESIEVDENGPAHVRLDSVATGAHPSHDASTQAQGSDDVAAPIGTSQPPHQSPAQPREPEWHSEDARVENHKNLTLIMKGGGVKGLAYVGAIKELMAAGYTFDWFVGTSAGAIAAVLLAAGYSIDELEKLLKEKRFQEFFDASWWKRWIYLVLYKGLYPGETLSEWIDRLLATKLESATRVKFSKLRYHATVYASQRNQEALRFDSHEDPEEPAAYAVRCSMSIPFVFIPESRQGLRAYDGGLQYNYPVEKFLHDNPGRPFIGLYLGPEIYEPVRQRSVFADLIAIWTESRDADALEKYKANTVIIDTRPIGTLDFALTEDEKTYLVECGRASALHFLRQRTDAYEAAIQSRDLLKARIEKARGAKRARRRKLLRNAAIGVIALVLVSIVLYWWFFVRIPTYAPPISDYLKRRDESGPAGSLGRASFFNKMAPRRVRWKGLIIQRITHGYLIQPDK